MDAIKSIDAAKEAPGGLCNDIWIYDGVVISVRAPREGDTIDSQYWRWSAMGAFAIATLNKSAQWKASVSSATFVTITRQWVGKTCIVNVAAGVRVFKEFPHELERTRIEVPCTAVWEGLPFPAVPPTAREAISKLLGVEDQRKVEGQLPDAGTGK